MTSEVDDAGARRMAIPEPAAELSPRQSRKELNSLRRPAVQTPPGGADTEADSLLTVT